MYQSKTYQVIYNGRQIMLANDIGAARACVARTSPHEGATPEDFDIIEVDGASTLSYCDIVNGEGYSHDNPGDFKIVPHRTKKVVQIMASVSTYRPAPEPYTPPTPTVPPPETARKKKKKA